MDNFNEIEILIDDFEYMPEIHNNLRIYRYFSIIEGTINTVKLNEEQYSELHKDYMELSDSMKKKFNFCEGYFIECILSYNC